MAAIAMAMGGPGQAQPRGSAKRVVWAPLADQWAQHSLIALGQLPAGHSEFTVGPCGDRYRRREVQYFVRSSLDQAHRRGIRSIDVMFFFDEGMFVQGVPQVDNRNPCWPFQILSPPRKNDPQVQGLIDVGTDWVKAVENFNTTCSPPACVPLALRLRLPATPQTLAYFRSTDPDAYRDLAPPLECAAHRTACDAFRPYRALVTVWDPARAAFKTTRTSEVLDLGREVIRRHVGLWLDRILDRVKALAPRTTVEMVSLALDVGGESSLFSSRGVTGFGKMGYADSPHPVPFFQQRQKHLKAMYQVFGERARARGVTAAVFYQSWVLDDTLRGAFDLADLLEGTGVKALHHTTWPRDPFAGTSTGLSELQHRMSVAASATVARRLGLELDTELSWPSYYPPGTFFSGGIYRWITEGGFGGPWGRYHVGDFDGDRLTDVLFRQADRRSRHSFHVALSGGSGFVPAGRWLRAADPGELVGIADFDGDGREDLLFRPVGTVDALAVSLAGDGRFHRPLRWAAPGHFRGRAGAYHVGDFDGDGRADVLFRPADASIDVSLSRGDRFAPPASWVAPHQFGGPGDRYLVGDFNGDGRKDLLFIKKDPPEVSAIRVTLSTGGGFFGPGSGQWVGENGFGGLWGRHYVGNFDGQGGDDLMFFEPSNNTVHVALAEGGSFLYRGVWLDPNHFGERPDGYVPGDYTGYFEADATGARVARPDGRVDLGYLDPERGEFHVAKTGDEESTVYNAFLRSDDNARAFHNQVRGGLKFGAAGMVYAQWTTGDLRAPPQTEAWRAVIGGLPPNDDHLYGEGGLLVAPSATFLPPARKAIYLSTLGKMRCEGEGTCRYPDYIRWFRDFGLAAELESRQVDVLTDWMVLNGSLGQYEAVYMPFETSMVIDPAACDALRRHQQRGSNLMRQVEKGRPQTAPFGSCP